MTALLATAAPAVGLTVADTDFTPAWIAAHTRVLREDGWAGMPVLTCHDRGTVHALTQPDLVLAAAAAGMAVPVLDVDDVDAPMTVTDIIDRVEWVCGYRPSLIEAATVRFTVALPDGGYEHGLDVDKVGWIRELLGLGAM